MIRFFSECKDFKFPRGFKTNSRRIIQTICQDYTKSLYKLNIIFVTDSQLLKINQEYLKHDFYTDIITFDYSDRHQIEGEIYISYDRVKENSLLFNVNIHDELRRLIIHGTLHLVGFNDHTEEERISMSEKENYYILLWHNLVKNGI